jgi:hypothetical protein
MKKRIVHQFGYLQEVNRGARSTKHNIPVSLFHQLCVVSFQDVVRVTLTCENLPVTIRNTRFNILKFCKLITLRLCVLCGSQKKQYLMSYTLLTD